MRKFKFRVSLISHFYVFQYLILLVIVGLAAADVPKEDLEAQIIPEDSKNFAEYFTNKGYDYGFKTSNKMLKEEDLDLNTQIVKGSYEYVSPEGKTIKVTYTAGPGIGFNPVADADIIHPKILESIELNLKNPPETK